MSVAVPAGCVPAVAALMLAAVDGSAQSRLEHIRVTRRKRQEQDTG